MLLAVADGAGNDARGAAAAEALVAYFATLDPAVVAHADFVAQLAACDGAFAAQVGGETTAVVALVTAAAIRGASVGDSAAGVSMPPATPT